MMKKSRLLEHLRELMDGVNQCGAIIEWVSELPS